jgi:hypothetical protein
VVVVDDCDGVANGVSKKYSFFTVGLVIVNS